MPNLLKNKTILITGGAGFIGSNLIEVLLQQDNKIVCLDNFSTGKRENLAPFATDENFTFIEGDIRDLETCHKAVKGVEIVLHQAALGSVPRSIKDPVTTNSVNIDGFLNMLVASKEADVRRFVYAASSSTYGDHTGLPKVEDKIGKPLSPYAVTKYVNELYADVFYKTYGLETIGLRYFNVFGKRQDPQGAYAAVIPKFINQLLKGESPTINGDGLTSRDFTYIDNVVQINQLAAITDNPEAINQVYNVAFGENTSLNEMITMIKSLLANSNPSIADIEVIYGPERTGDVKHSLADIYKARELLGYEPEVDFNTGLERTIEWFIQLKKPHLYNN
jgi:UDP-N-acetylglucosamine/UDP-N-acetyl-alpha-D-glucosaminouronate 4-epimerase